MGDNIITPLAGESVMAKGIEHTPWTQSTHSNTRDVKAQPPLDGYLKFRPSRSMRQYVGRRLKAGELYLPGRSSLRAD